MGQLVNIRFGVVWFLTRNLEVIIATYHSSNFRLAGSLQKYETMFFF
jgi:hypothetical protein